LLFPIELRDEAVHGLGGLKEQYFPHLAKVCENLGLDVIMPNFGSYRENTNYKIWKTKFDNEISQKIDNETIVVANSLGTQFIVKILAEKKIDVGAYISVAGAGEILNLLVKLFHLQKKNLKFLKI